MRTLFRNLHLRNVRLTALSPEPESASTRHSHTLSAIIYGIFSALLMSAEVSAADADASAVFSVVNTSDSTLVTPRHEGGSLVYAGKLYLIGGRSQRPVESYDPVSNSWTNHGFPSFEINHFQPVAWNGKFYLVGALECCYPEENVFTNIQIFDPFTEEWTVGSEMPAARVRGSAGAVVYNDKIYLLGGNTLGHNGGAVAWFDEYDPATDTWRQLPDAPNARDHFSLTLVGNKLVAAGGRRSGLPNPFLNLVPQVDVYDLATAQWDDSGDDIPTPRAGAMAVSFGDEAILIGGEIAENPLANTQVEAFNVLTGTWRSLQSLDPGTHTGAAGMLGDYLHVVSGSNLRGGGGETDLHVRARIDNGVPDSQDSDGDGLTDADENTLYQTNPLKKDSDDDGLDDNEELNAQTDPNDADSDNDSLSDGDELNKHNSNPLVADTDSDSIEDADEVSAGLNPASADTDNDGLQDGHEINVTETNPLKADSDGDGLLDGLEINTHNTNPNQEDSDADGLDDAKEISVGSNPTVKDTDADGVSDVLEVLTYYSDPTKSDTDGDGLDDNAEVNELYTSPITADSDADGLDDGVEVNTWSSDPNEADSDSDGLSDGDEVNIHGTSPILADSDEDGANDKDELDAGYNPVNPDSDGDGILDGVELGSTDSGSTDSGSTDSGSTDSGSTDSGSTDSGSTDSGSTDSGSTDSGSTDSGSTDSGETGAANSGGGSGSGSFWLLGLLLFFGRFRRQS